LIHRYKCYRPADLLGRILQITFIFVGQNHGRQTRAVGGQHLPFKPPMGITISCRVTSPVMPTLPRNGRPLNKLAMAVTIAMPAPNPEWTFSLNFSIISVRPHIPYPGT